jgi:hypothetical protein
MLPVQLDQPIRGDLPQPRVKGQGSMTHIVGQFAIRFGQDILNDVGGIDANGQTPVHAEADELAQAAPMLGEQLIAGRAVAVRHPA